MRNHTIQEFQRAGGRLAHYRTEDTKDRVITIAFAVVPENDTTGSLYYGASVFVPEPYKMLVEPNASKITELWSRKRGLWSAFPALRNASPLSTDLAFADDNETRARRALTLLDEQITALSRVKPIRDVWCKHTRRLNTQQALDRLTNHPVELDDLCANANLESYLGIARCNEIRLEYIRENIRVLGTCDLENDTDVFQLLV